MGLFPIFAGVGAGAGGAAMVSGMTGGAAYDQFLSSLFSWGLLLWNGDWGVKDGVEPPEEKVNGDVVGAKEGIFGEFLTGAALLSAMMLAVE